jgi:hypothetical protein
MVIKTGGSSRWNSGMIIARKLHSNQSGGVQEMFPDALCQFGTWKMENMKLLGSGSVHE